MERVKKKEIERIAKMAEKEFPQDPALQQVHIARKVISKEAELAGLSFIDYIKNLAEQARGAH